MKLVYLEWQDAMSKNSWIHDSEIDNWAKDGDWVKQVGWVVRENKKYMIIAGQWNPEIFSNGHLFGNLQKIPKTWIRKRKTLKQ